MRRRSFLLAAGLAPLAGLPLRLFAAPDEEHFFVFVFCNGGWDQTRVFAPVFDGRFPMEAQAQAANVGGVDFVDHPDRPSVREFFSQHASEACLLNGLEIQSVSHPSATRRVFSGGLGDDWGTTLAAAGGDQLLMPHVLVSGPGFSDRWTSKVVRVGETGQLGPLLDGTALDASDVPVAGLDPLAEEAVDAYVRQRASGDVLARLDELDWLLAGAEQLPVSGNALAPLRERLALPLTAFEQGLARVATVEFLGLNEMGWDQHSEIAVQSAHFELLFGQLLGLFEELEQRGLRQRTTVVVFSEMGRNPTPNGYGGKDHWTFTSAMLLGHRVAGGQTLGAWDQDCLGLPIDPLTGAVGELAMHGVDFGATVLALAGLEAPIGGTPVLAAVR